MHSKDYIELAKKTESNDHRPIVERLSKDATVRLLHAAMGVSTEAGELLDAMKKYVFYGKKLDETNLLEEVGDVFWYLAILADELGFDFETAMQKNIAKLQARYGEAFSSERAQVRDLEKERQTLN
jgi:NTP pyrophosphatase (non-canonical NTP hydrolase)